MPAVSKKQQKFFGIVRAIQKGKMAPTTPETAKAAADMKKGDVKKFASTKHKGLPEKKKPTFKESAFTNITVGNKVGQTFQHASGATITLDNTMSDPSDLPSQVTIDLGFGDFLTVDAPSTNEYGIAGITSSLGNAGGGGGVQTRQRTKTAAEINLQLDASQQASGAETAKVGEITDPLKFSNQIQAADAAYTQRQAKIQALNDEKGKVYDRYRSQYDVLNNKMQKIQSKYFNQDTLRTDDAVNDDPEYKALLKQMQKLSDAEKAEIDRLDAETQIPYASDYQLPGTKEYKDMKPVSFDEYFKGLSDFDYNKTLMGNPQTRWTKMDLWADQNKSSMNLSRIQALKDLPDPATGKPYDLRRLVGIDADTELGEYVREKLKNVGGISFTGPLGTHVGGADLELMVLTKGAPALDVYVDELKRFEKYMTEVNNILEKDLKETKKNLRIKRYKTSSEIQRITHEQAENLKYYQDKLNQIKNFKGNISRIIPAIQKAFAGNFEPTPTPIKPPKPPAGFNYMDDMPSGEGTFDADGNYIPPGFEDAIRTDQINDAELIDINNLDNQQIDSAVKDVGGSFGPNVGTGFRIFGDFLTKGWNKRFVADRKYLGKEYMNRQFFPNVTFDKDGTYFNNKDVVIGSGQPAKYNEKTGMIEVRATFDFKKNAHEVESAIASEKDAKADWAGRFARTGSEYALDAMVDAFPGVLKPLSGMVASQLISIAKFSGKGKAVPIVIKITPAELKKKNKKAYEELVELGVIKKKKVNESKLSFELIQQFKEGLNPDRPKKLKEQTTFAQMQQRIRDAKEKRREQQKKSEKLYMDTKRKGVKFYDKKGTGRLKDGKKIYD